MLHDVYIDIGGTTFSFVIFLEKKLIYKSECYNIRKYDNHSKFLEKLNKDDIL